MTTYIFSLLGLVTLCVFWAVFQQWLSKHDPDTEKRPAKCGGCNEQCEK
jgi:hypothetical protein